MYTTNRLMLPTIMSFIEFGPHTNDLSILMRLIGLICSSVYLYIYKQTPTGPSTYPSFGFLDTRPLFLKLHALRPNSPIRLRPSMRPTIAHRVLSLLLLWISCLVKHLTGLLLTRLRLVRSHLLQNLGADASRMHFDPTRLQV
ncbi:hypothetical protein F5890DRAFT_595552 [Lentinula detonsa]|uniref:Uncharacterized protein n=1 Tax=Lentinula detonsa TaxID=2804962 RepID=A0AA38UNM3_9AGAR|nr:hypothetical protein F5890DRAFT_595552 [Lentinula detonsa]